MHKRQQQLVWKHQNKYNIRYSQQITLSHKTIVEDNAELEITNDRLEKQTSELSAAASINTQEKKTCSLVLKFKK